MKAFLPAILVLCLPAAVSLAQEKPQAYVGAKLLTIAGPEIENGVLVVQGGKIVAVGSAADVQIPADAERHDLKGKVLMPGLVDTHSHIGGPAGGDGAAAIKPDCRGTHAIKVPDTGAKKGRGGGGTPREAMPGSADP